MANYRDSHHGFTHIEYEFTKIQTIDHLQPTLESKLAQDERKGFDDLTRIPTNLYSICFL